MICMRCSEVVFWLHIVSRVFRMKYIYYIFFIFLFFAGCSTLSVESDYDDGYDFSKVKTYTVKHHAKEGENTLLNDRITAALEHVISSKGYQKQDDKGSDLIFVYHYNVKDKVDIRTDYQMVGIRRYGYGGGMVATTNSYEYKEGTIIVDALDKNSKKIVWRSVGVLEVEQKDTPQERKKYVSEIITKLMEKFPKKLP